MNANKLEEWRAPTVPDGHKIVFDECGRVLDFGKSGKICFRSHWFRVTEIHGGYTIRVKHGGGEESQELRHWIVPALFMLDSDNRYLMLHQLHYAYRSGFDKGTEETANKYRRAFVENRLKKRKVRGQDAYEVSIH